MNRSTATISALLAASLAGMLLLWQTAPDDISTPTTEADVAQTAPQRTTTASAGGGDEAGMTVVEASLLAWRSLHEPVGYLSQEDTEALIAEREAAAEALAAAIGAQDGEALEDVLAALRAAERSRDKLVMIDGLGRSASPSALSILEEVYDTESSYTLKSHVIRALGDSPAEGHHELLLEQLWEADDERLQQLSAQGLYGEEVAADALVEVIYSELPVKVRLEAIHSLGATGTEGAQQALEAVAASEELEARVKVYAEKELIRSFG